MEVKGLVLCLAAALLAVSHGCYTGKEFITAFLPNFLDNYRSAFKLSVVVTAQDSGQANVHIQVASCSFSKQLTLSAGASKSVDIPCGCRLHHSFVPANSAVRISSDAAISVVSFNQRFATGDSAVVFPKGQLGTDYVVFTPNGRYRRMQKLLAIVNDNKPNKITITPARTHKLGSGEVWTAKKKVTITLKPYETYLVASKTILTGTHIHSEQPVAVLAGHQCLAFCRTCDHVYWQLPPVARLGKEYLVPIVDRARVRTWVVVVAAEDNTKVILHGKRKCTRTLKKAGHSFVRTMRTPLLVKSNKKILVQLLSNNVPFDPFLLTMTPTDKLATSWAVETMDGYRNFVSILSEREGAGSVKVCTKAGCLKPVWKSFQSDKNWVWSVPFVTRSQHHVKVEGDARMAVYAFGGKHRHSYGTVGVCSEGPPQPPTPPNPCENVKCRVKEHCVNGKCVHTSTATCYASGDPHYSTFDGRRYDFQGTCTYIMATVTPKAADLQPFTVMTKNNHRGSLRVSYVRTITVTVYKQTVVIGRHRGQVEVNGEVQNLPVKLLGGRIRVRKSGVYAVLKTDFGLNVKYDRKTRLYITVPSSYYNHLGGLCGNYNGDHSDDLPIPKGSPLSAVLDMIKEWKVKDPDLFCNDNCGGRCPQCSVKKQDHYRQPTLCGILIKADGPFSVCHKKVDPSMYMDNCVYDVCLNKGARQDLCENLKSYYDACLTEGVKVKPQWRTITNCPLPCPKGSHYEACGNACPATCGSLNSKEKCEEPCVEGCQCDKGWVLSGDRCVPQAKCGCQYDGKYYHAGFKFWGNNACTMRCQCNNGQAKCRKHKCKKNEHCGLKAGVRDCYPTSYATCKGSGDPHYQNFDGRRFDFQGTCIYVLAQYKGSDESLAPFQVLVQNENRGRNKAVSYTKSVSLIVFGEVIVSMSHASPGKVLVNSRSVNLPYSMEDGMLTVFRKGQFAVVRTNFGLRLRFNWKSYVSVTLPSSYSSTTSGLCGNYNGKRNDDLMTPKGTQAKNINHFGHSWKVGGDAGCTSDCPAGKCPECEPALLTRYHDKQYCGILSDKNGPFKKCHSKLDHTPFLTDCVFDLCMYQGHVSTLCNSLSDYSDSCQEARGEVEKWRTEDFCPLTCGANSHYELCARPCQLTCNGLSIPEGCDENAPCKEDCVCDDGFILSNDKCVPVAECGCQYEGQYYHNGQVFFPGHNCDTRCVCSDGGNVECNHKFQCSPTEKCILKEGVRTCAPKNLGSCSVRGARTVRTFDGKDYPLWGNCLFTLAEVEEEGGKTPFTVLVEQQTSSDGSVYRDVELQVYGMDIAMHSGVVWEVEIDDIRVSLPVSLAEGKVQAYQNGINIIIETDFELQLTYDTVAGVLLQIPSTYQNLPKGLCGNYNSKGADDLASNKPTDMAALWITQKANSTCETSCDDISCPGPDKQKVPEAIKACDIIKNQNGPFVGCHSTVSPKASFDACVRELATGKGGKKILCRHIQNYVAVCQLAGAKIKKWRSKEFCPLTCSKGSHYELCTSSCSSTCFSLQQPLSCPVCQEGCQCDDDLMFNGAQCVPVKNCGCVVDGQYYKSGSSVFLEECVSRCECQSGKFSCKPTSCKETEECLNKDGILGCYPKDPCAEVKCRVKEHCVVSEDEGVCVPDSKATCWTAGDPHYSTFDGWRYSFQGTCSYVLVNTTGKDPSLPEVTVTTKNELRGNADGSFLHSVTVDMLSHRIIIPSNDKDIVLVDGRRSRLPVHLEEGSISITGTGLRGKIQSDIGVEVTFDWTTVVIVSISSSYFGQVAGLCGNYNGKKDDELTTPGGSTAANVTVWAETWSVPDGDPFCYHFCDGVCPQCSKADQQRFAGPQYCGILSNKKGPFAACHDHVPIREFALDCLYDVCINEGRHEVLCNVLSAYMAECQEAGVTVKPWRELAKCPVICPAHSHYQECGTACPATCSPQLVVCPKICVEGCFCDAGYVRSGKECVLKEKGCGCTYDGIYYLPGEVFWADSQCENKCTCNAATRKVQCEKTKCHTGETCSVVDGVQDCYPVSFKTCTARGDPHFKSFDGLKFDFQGNCVYNLASLCKDAKGLQHFEVHLENNNRGSKRVSYAKVVTVKVYDVTYTLSMEYPGKVLVNGLQNSLPLSYSESRVHVYRRHRLAVIETNFLKVSFDFASAVRVELASSYHGATCGLCGNMNNIPADDMKLPNGKVTSNANEFGVSQWVADVPGCSHDCKDCAQPLPPDFKSPSYTSVCDIITAKDGPLADCIGRVDAKQYREDCIFDMVLNEGKQRAACDIISEYVEECQREGGCVKSWRTRKFCWMHCPANSMYSITAPSCPKSCASLSSPAVCKTPPSEGCVCNPGYLLRQDECVPLSECGCHYDGQLIMPGQTFYPNADCSHLCKCLGGNIDCQAKPCGPKKSCKVKKGLRRCFPGNKPK